MLIRLVVPVFTKPLSAGLLVYDIHNLKLLSIKCLGSYHYVKISTYVKLRV